MITYRKAIISDLSLLIHMEKNCFHPCDRFTPEVFKRMLQNPKNSIISEIIEYNGKSAGYAVFFTRKNSRKIRLYSICILPEYAGKGIAKQYFQEIIPIVSKCYHTMSLEVRKNNQRAINLYDFLGFKINKTISNYYPDGEEALQMLKILKTPH